MNVEIIWSRIVENIGREFIQIRGRIFTYELKGSSSIRPNTTNRIISKSQIEKALEFVPLENTAKIQNLQAPSYIYAILMDDRIRKNDW
ncbi:MULTISPECIES: hypothetical protein [unclassified Clostridium]|uniref:hypothetical protein n=1 Tax=unclassified Clostridium TaxID=2614128 RepID=UPI000EE5A238|nr:MULTISPECIES: hypothetical protein [unclassified Clostridium]HCQ91503.1 hypothetical protein [Clostridium sp.]